MPRVELLDVQIGSRQLAHDSSEQLRRRLTLEEGRQETGPVGCDYETAGLPDADSHAHPGDPAELLGTVEEEDVPRFKTPEHSPVLPIQPRMGLS